LCGVYLNRARALNLLIYVFVVLILQFASVFFILIGLDSETADYAQKYLNISLVGVFFNIMGAANKLLMNCMGHQREPMIIQMIVTTLHFGLCHVLTYHFGFGIFGPPIAIALSNFNNFALLHFMTSKILIKDERVKLAWFPPSKSSFRCECLIEFMKVGLPSIGVLILSWWSFELMSLFAAGISVKCIAI
jgi:Na+-driven multidrug efflux pump